LLRSLEKAPFGVDGEMIRAGHQRNRGLDAGEIVLDGAPPTLILILGVAGLQMAFPPRRTGRRDRPPDDTKPPPT